MHENNCFITLTFAEEHLPEDRSLDVKTWQAFAKRLRHNVGPFRFYHCGEYGDNLGRPHYHALLFGIDFQDDREFLAMSGDYPLWTSKELDKAWKWGFSTIGEMDFTSAAYVAGYVQKKITGDAAEAHYTDKITGVFLKPEYATMSRRPGIGDQWYRKYGGETYVTDSVIMDGHEMRPPRFYDTLLEREYPEEFERVKTQRVAKMVGREEEETADRLAARERFDESKTYFFRRAHGEFINF